MRPVGKSRWRRLILGPDGDRLLGSAADLAGDLGRAVLAIIGARSLGRGLVLGIDFEGGVAWDVPAGQQFTIDDARQVLERQRDLDATAPRSRSATPTAATSSRSRSTTSPQDVRVKLQEAFAEAAGVEPAEVSVTSVSATWGEEITRKAVQALVVFLALIALYISIRFEWRMALTAILAMIHDVLVSVGIYSCSGSRSRRRPSSPS